MGRKGDMKIKDGIIAYHQNEKDPDFILIDHFCGYEHVPTNADFLSLTEELNTDPEFELIGKIGVNVFLMRAPKEIVKEMAKRFNSA